MMDVLQDNGLVSDLCVNIEDVPDSDWQFVQHVFDSKVIFRMVNSWKKNKE